MMIPGIPLSLGLRARMQDVYAYVVFGVPSTFDIRLGIGERFCQTERSQRKLPLRVEYPGKRPPLQS